MMAAQLESKRGTKKGPGWYVVGGMHVVRTSSYGSDSVLDWLVIERADLAESVFRAERAGRVEPISLSTSGVVDVFNTLRDASLHIGRGLRHLASAPTRGGA